MLLKLRWARFFTLAGWNWRLAPPHSGFDFLVDWPGVDSDDNRHSLLVRICEKNHPALIARHDDLWDIHRMYESPHPALFGDGPENTHWQMAWGSGGGYYCLDNYCVRPPFSELWERASHE